MTWCRGISGRAGLKSAAIPRHIDKVAAIDKKIVQYAISVGATSTGGHSVGTGKIGDRGQERGEAVDPMAIIKTAIDPVDIMILAKSRRDSLRRPVATP